MFMLDDRHLSTFFSTILLYLGMVALFISFRHTFVGTEEKPQEKIISFSLAAYEPELPLPVEAPPAKALVQETIEKPESIAPEPIVEKVIAKEPVPEEPILEKPEIEKPKPEPIIEKTILKPSPVKKKSVKKEILKKKMLKKPKQKSKKVLKKKVKKRLHQKRVLHKIRKKAKTNKMASKRQASPAKKNRFLNQLRAKINRYKTYPRIAQRRGMQGTVTVKFTILANGQLGNISVSGPKAFHRSVKGAVKKAFPIAVQNAPLSLPTTVNLTLRYQLH